MIRPSNRQATSGVALSAGSEERRLPRAGVVTALVLVYAALLHVGYVATMVPEYHYLGFEYRTPSVAPYTLALATVVAVALLMPSTVEHASDLMLWLVYVLVLVPTVLISQYNPLVSTVTGTMLGLNMSFALLLARALARVRPRMHVEKVAVQFRPMFVMLAVLASVALIAYLAYSRGLSTQLIGFRDVYARRADFQDTQAALVSYVAPVFYNVLGPTLLALGLVQRRRWLTGLGVALQVVLFLSIAFKTILFSIVVVVLLYYGFRRRRVGAAQVIGATGAAAVLCVALDRLLPLGLTDLFVRRLVYFPGVISDVYMSVFDGHGKTNFFEVLPFLSSQAQVPGTPALVVGDVYFGGGVNANASFWMHGFASYGYAGMYVVTLVFVIILWLADDSSRDLPRPLAMSIFVMPGLAICEASIFSSLLTHGVLAAVLVAALVPREDRYHHAVSQPHAGRTPATRRHGAH